MSRFDSYFDPPEVDWQDHPRPMKVRRRGWLPTRHERKRRAGCTRCRQPLSRDLECWPCINEAEAEHHARWESQAFDVADLPDGLRPCSHGVEGPCGDCDALADFAYKADRERRFSGPFGR